MRRHARGPRVGIGPESLALRDVDVEVAIVVVIEKRHAGRQDLRIVELPRRAVEVHEVQTGFLRAVGEPVLASRCGAVCRCRRGGAVV
jgi:hypothetical protein